jgi:hypothetical protein
MFRGKKLAGLLLGLAAFAALTLASQRASAFKSTPPGVDPGAWHPISDDLGVVVRPVEGPAGRQELYGSLMLRERGEWRPVTLESGPPRLVPARERP